MWTSRANEIFYQKSYKICDQIKLFGDLWRAVFGGKWTLDVDPKNWKKWIHEGNLKFKGVASSKATIFASIQGPIQGSKRLVDGIRCGLFFLCCSPFYVVHLFFLREASFPIKNEQSWLELILFNPNLGWKSPPYLFYPYDFFCVNMHDTSDAG